MTVLAWSPAGVAHALGDREKPIFRPAPAHGRGPTKQGLARLGRVVRARVSDWTLGNPKVDSGDLMGACGIAAHALNEALRALGHEPVFCMWTWLGSHCWTEVGRWAVDLTATQFNSRGRAARFPGVYVVRRELYDVVDDEPICDMGAGDCFRRGESVELEVLRDWGHQSPAQYEDRVAALARELAAVHNSDGKKSVGQCQPPPVCDRLLL